MKTGLQTLNSKESAEVREAIRKLALLNALNYDGKARTQTVLGKLLAERPDLKTMIKEVASLVDDVIEEVNRLSMDEQRTIVKTNWPETLDKEKVEEKRALPPLPNVRKYERVVTRFAPNPDCLLHLGSARAIILCYEYAKMYDGLFYLRFEDTDPRLKKSALQFYDLIREDISWLQCKWDAEFIQSDRIPLYYEYAEEILKDGNAYICTCKRQEFAKSVAQKQPCPDRDLTPKENLTRWEHMLDGTYDVGDAVVRIKTSLDHPNPAVRDWPALRIIDTKKHSHPRVGSKYRVWPLYNFACGVDDHLLGVTHIIRGKEHVTNQTRQEYMYRHFGWEYPEAIHYGRLKITGAFLSKSKILQGLKNGMFKGWDDPRLATFAALRRRGITPKAIKRMIIAIGPKPVDVVLSWENLYAYNRKLIDHAADRYFFVHDPVELQVAAIPDRFVARLRLHPDDPERGFRCVETVPEDGSASFLISSDDVGILKSRRNIRLMGLFNIGITEVEGKTVGATFLSEAYEEARKIGAPLIHWIPSETGIPCEVVMPDASVAAGMAEDSCKTLNPGAIVQFERFGFVRVDQIDRKLVTYFAHR
jgi:glutamyl-tRNA synthetase